ncbi:MAG: excinuclease ABC subunit C, partial [Candidatus Portnoybacteria bacterium CG02_land_8_20_14_3_00_45_8]
MYYVYLLRLEGIKNKDFYIGYTSDLKERMKQHVAG